MGNGIRLSVSYVINSHYDRFHLLILQTSPQAFHDDPALLIAKAVSSVDEVRYLLVSFRKECEIGTLSALAII